MKTFSSYDIEIKGRTGQIKTLCPKCSPARKKSKTPCLSVNVDKETWLCWHCDWKGGLKQGQESTSNPYKWQSKTYIKPEFAKITDLPKKIVEWFHGRGISEKVLKRNNINYATVYMPQIEQEVLAIQFPYYREGVIVNIKYRDNRKNLRMASGSERILYGLDDCKDMVEVIIVEGEIEKLTIEMAGYVNVLSVPDGAPSVNTKNYETKFDYLDSASELLGNVKTVILAIDNDEPGKKLEEELARRIGKEKCKQVAWPEGCKDANDVLVKEGLNCLKECIKSATPYPIKGIFELKDVADKIMSLYDKGGQDGLCTGWHKLSQYYTVRPGEFTVVTGIPSHGKSEMVDALIMNLGSKHGWRFGIYSPENQHIERHADKLIAKFKGRPFSEGYKTRLSRNEVECSIELLQDYYNFILPGIDDNHSIHSVLGLAKILVLRKGIKGIVIDPWNELDHSRPQGLTETEHISKCLSKIRKFTRVYDVHVWVIVHPTKLQKDKNTGEYPVPTAYDCAGSSHWFNKADNIICVWRDVKNPGSPVQIHIQKIRFREVGQIGMVELNYDSLSGRYS